ncbi:uncharacterized CRM domain-containing protein At3g25440, chloroplastic isoform X2 [Cryptomeria japonica]|uniref:uncharacterized CRM domain-containing protein At3g25440, chloroplastic isoform X2 n=1 Tax=Cryptomeria japonica TaxID=3369 RepID=UPI0027D9CF2C|nr:uncharacterized CRM domain-containing protein At3g25440, chloroplastic isoform X2 [Cryptomeria japonica]
MPSPFIGDNQQPTCGAVHNFTGFSALNRGVVTCAHFYVASPLHRASYELEEPMVHFTICMSLSSHTLSQIQSVRFMSNRVVKVDVRNGIARFDIGEPDNKNKSKQHNKEISEKRIRKQKKKEKKSKKAKKSELRFYRLKARKKLKSSNPEVRIKYKLEKAKRKEAWLIEKLLKYEIPKARFERHDPEPLTAEERFYLKRTGQKQKNYVPVGVRGIFGGVILNMHLHWKRHETVKVICKPCKPGQIHQYADEIARLSGGIPIDIRLDTIIFYRGKNYVQPEIMSPTDTLSKKKALEKYMFEQSLDSVKQFIAVLERELEDYQRHVALYGKPGDPSSRTKSTAKCETDKPSVVKDYKGEDVVSHGRVNDCRLDRLTGSRHGCSLDVNNSCLVSTAESEEGDSELDDLDMDSLQEDELDSLTGSETEEEDHPI